MTVQRNLETKADGATVSVRTSIQIGMKPKASVPATPRVAQMLGYGSQMPGYGSEMLGYGSYVELVTFEVETLILKLNGETHAVLALCEDYLTLLERLVRDFKAAHG